VADGEKRGPARHGTGEWVADGEPIPRNGARHGTGEWVADGETAVSTGHEIDRLRGVLRTGGDSGPVFGSVRDWLCCA